MRMIKQAIMKEDGRRLTFYWFAKKPLQVECAKSKEERTRDDDPKS